MKKHIKILFALKIFMVALFFQTTVLAEDLESVLDLRGMWKFTIGDNLEWAQPEFNDESWGQIRVPSSWESNGFVDYNGFAWYRTSFVFNNSMNANYVYLVLGYIDDADEVYINGTLVGGMGSFPPYAKTAGDEKRKYPVPVGLFNKDGKNTIAVRVYDFYDRGGIIRGDIGLFLDRHEKLLEINLAGYWDFETEDELKLRKANGESQSKNKIFVPGTWESQGYKDYNGKARYRTDFKVSSELMSEELYLILGYIDDIETVYINGHKIGSIVSLEKEQKTGLPYYIQFRGYKIPEGVLKATQLNSLSVVVYDGGGLGGIYYGPVGIATYDGYVTLKELNTRRPGFWETFFKVGY